MSSQSREKLRRKNIEDTKVEIDYEKLQKEREELLKREASIGPRGGNPWEYESLFGPLSPEAGSKPWEEIPDYAWILVVIFGLLAAIIWIAFFLL